MRRLWSVCQAAIVVPLSSSLPTGVRHPSTRRVTTQKSPTNGTFGRCRSRVVASRNQNAACVATQVHGGLFTVRRRHCQIGFICLASRRDESQLYRSFFVAQEMVIMATLGLPDAPGFRLEDLPNCAKYCGPSREMWACECEPRWQSQIVSTRKRP